MIDHHVKIQCQDSNSGNKSPLHRMHYWTGFDTYGMKKVPDKWCKRRRSWIWKTSFDTKRSKKRKYWLKKISGFCVFTVIFILLGFNSVFAFDYEFASNKNDLNREKIKNIFSKINEFDGCPRSRDKTLQNQSYDVYKNHKTDFKRSQKMMF